MKNLILAVIMVVMISTPCLAELEPEGLFSIEGTLWSAPGLEFEGIEGYELYFGFTNHVTFLCINSGVACEPYGMYVEVPGGSINYLSVFGPLFGSAPGILLPYLGVGILIYKNLRVFPMLKVSDNWTPPLTTTTTTIDETTTTTTAGGGDFDITMVSIPGGTFEMGCPFGDIRCPKSDQLPYHTVTISAFKMSAYEITQGQWEAVMGSNPAYFDECGSNCPVEWVSWNEVQDFIEELNNQTGKQYRLPTEAEWEYAARAGTTTIWYCGDYESCLDDYAWYSVNSGDKTHPVGQKQPNAWGLYDMSGNVWEWCSDWYNANYYSESPSTNPQGPDKGEERVLRGGMCGWYARYCRSANRYQAYPHIPFFPIGVVHVGFRLCLP